MSDTDISIREVGRTGRITLARPKALNALTYEMSLDIETALDRWRSDGDIDLILIDAEGEKAFCAGGDLSRLYKTGTAGDFGFGRKFWADEYRLNAKIANCPVPFAAIMDGFVMGGGVGVSAHGSCRVVTERSVVAMPECGIGLAPDVGGTWLLAQAPGHLGEFLGITGWHMNGADAIFAGFADCFVPGDRLEKLKAALESQAATTVLDDYISEPETAPVARHLETLDRYFGQSTLRDCIASLENDPSEFAQKAAAMARKVCPLSAACAFEMVRRARNFSSVEEALSQEYRFTYRSMSDGQFLEGVRALIVDKDRQPQWRPTRIEGVTDEMVERMLAPLGDDELRLEG